MRTAIVGCFLLLGACSSGTEVAPVTSVPKSAPVPPAPPAPVNASLAGIFTGNYVSTNPAAMGDTINVTAYAVPSVDGDDFWVVSTDAKSGCVGIYHSPDAQTQVNAFAIPDGLLSVSPFGAPMCSFPDATVEAQNVSLTGTVDAGVSLTVTDEKVTTPAMNVYDLMQSYVLTASNSYNTSSTLAGMAGTYSDNVNGSFVLDSMGNVTVTLNEGCGGTGTVSLIDATHPLVHMTVTFNSQTPMGLCTVWDTYPGLAYLDVNGALNVMLDQNSLQSPGSSYSMIWLVLPKQ